MRGGKGIVGIISWCSGILLIALPCVMVIWGSWMDYALLMLSMVIEKFLILFFLIDSFGVFVDVHPKSLCSIFASSDPCISCRWNHDLFLSTVLMNFYSVVWPLANASLVVSK